MGYSNKMKERSGRVRCKIKPSEVSADKASLATNWRNASEGFTLGAKLLQGVEKNYEIIKEGIKRDGQQTYMLQLTDKHNNTLMVELSGDGIYWNINTAGIF